jgi:ADP-L-glycero-D-manno-heptose 6-epimerase
MLRYKKVQAVKIILTGGAGFIGSCILRTLNDIGINDAIVVDNIASTEKWRNLANKKYSEYIHKDCLFEQIESLKNITHVIHIGACSATTERNFDYLYANNVAYTKRLWNFCAEQNISFIYASSAATYGAGEQGFSDENSLENLMPLNGYGYSKHLVDIWVELQTKFPKQYVGLKFFNVYGPNEYHKGTMASVIYHGFKQIRDSGKIKLFKSYKPDYADGGQLRDFVYVKDVCDVVKFFIEHPEKNGLYNVGSGKAESFETLGKSIFKALNMPENIEYIEMPEYLRNKYQYYTEAAMSKLRGIGYAGKFCSLENGTIDYVRNYLANNFEIW